MRHLILCSALGLGLLGQLPVVAAPPAYMAALTPTETLPAQGWGTGLTASYFSNGSLAGQPVLKRQDEVVDFRWGLTSPAPGLPADNFSVRWEGLIAAPGTGRYRFVAVTTDEVRLWVNGRMVIDTWDGKKSSSKLDNSISLAAGEKATIKLEYNNAAGMAGIQLHWVAPGQGQQLIPTGNLYPLGSPTTPDPAGTPPVAKAAVAPAPRPEPAPVAAPKPAPVVAAAPKPAPAAAPKPAPAPKTAKPAPAVAAAPAKKPAAEDEVTPVGDLSGLYVITVRSTGKPLEVTQDRPATLAEQLAMAGAPPAADPQWRLEPTGSGLYRIVVPGSNKVLEVLGSSTSNGAPASLWTYYSGYNQQWKIEPTDDGYFKLISKNGRNKALTDKDSVDGGIQQWRYTGKLTQQWKLTPAKASEEPILAGANVARKVGSNSMSVYPNPSNGVMQMAYSLSEAKPLGWVLYNQNGVAVRVSDYRKQPAGSHHQTLNFSSLPAGDYYLSLTVGASNTRQVVSIRRPGADAPEVGNDAAERP
ncbi:RICIN domain-containing protein [Hymenobacter terrestris]|uniref:RICIN domain-containing protein n=1 Tax=Hymenobacter terrestris TaxID=2748310 RepID=A0ABX2PZ38_9BACT|nr:RICIN domain-containing protein [Hymenobacter terrestris]NVO83943.1 RICIN domain-containing protein [Hymenobacter terrestris]